MARSKTLSTLLALAIGLAGGHALAAPPAKSPPKKSATAKKAPKPKKAPPMSAANKKKLGEIRGPFKFGMTKDEIIGVLQKQLDERYAEQIQATTDVAVQDKLRRDKRAEIDRVKKTFLAFDGKKSGWDVSLIEDQFAHNTGESMLVYWENQQGKNQRRFFFFHDGKLYKMFLSLDTSIVPEEKRNFATFKSVMEANYGRGLVEGDRITWQTSEFHAQAIDKLKSYDALCLVIWDPKEMVQLAALRKEKAPPPPQQSGVIKQVLDKGDEKPKLDENKGAVDAIIQGGGGTAPKK